MQALRAALETSYRAVVVDPMWNLYVHGYWNGRDESDVCASLTGHDAVFWASNMDECRYIVDRRVTSISSVVLYTSYFVLLGMTIARTLNFVWNTTGHFIHRQIGTQYALLPPGAHVARLREQGPSQ